MSTMRRSVEDRVIELIDPDYGNTAPLRGGESQERSLIEAFGPLPEDLRALHACARSGAIGPIDLGPWEPDSVVERLALVARSWAEEGVPNDEIWGRLAAAPPDLHGDVVVFAHSGSAAYAYDLRSGRRGQIIQFETVPDGRVPFAADFTPTLLDWIDVRLEMRRLGAHASPGDVDEALERRGLLHAAVRN